MFYAWRPVPNGLNALHDVILPTEGNAVHVHRVLLQVKRNAVLGVPYNLS
jgi:hypothetical protein